ncbi:zinc ribbon-containing protein [Simiduia sp. 21SJ11W-1]|uniref:zinc ribbon-containing protein n=1 Tax=Simiduia sp. 21SJ11W-1 TaxID=2909669 RepID=UPI0020A092B5|nr:zinc ribbon-containing protein [Simiduia sp. 21SJ11W-1]UTA48757.1 zinc ribbon-containing protein [Simiduia sp. 21SJ11W-1]
MHEQPKPETQPEDLGRQLGDGLAEEINSFVRLELAAEQMLEDEAALVGAYLKDDVAQAQSYLAELRSELLMLEARAGYWLLEAADPARLDWLRLHRHISHGEQLVMADEVAQDCRLQCLACGAVTRVRGLVTLAPCQACGCEMFQPQAAH